MRQLTGLDASSLYLETPNAPMHISGLGIYDQSTVMPQWEDLLARAAEAR